jgi:hypothetical protein
MKVIALFIVIACTCFSCTNHSSTNSTSTEEVTLPPKTNPDKSPVEKIDAFANAVKIVKTAIHKDKSIDENGINYQLKMVYLDDFLVKLTVNYATNEFQDNTMYYIRNGKLILYDAVRTSIVKKEDELAEVVGTKVYLENGKILEVLEKSKKSKPGGNLSLMDEYYASISVNQDSMQSKIQEQLAFFTEKL